MQYSDKGFVGEGTIIVPNIGRLVKHQLGKHWQHRVGQGHSKSQSP